MNIRLRILYNLDTLETLKNSSQLGAFDEDTFFELDSDSDTFNRVLEVTRKTSGSWFNPIMSFTPVELRGVRYFQPECRHMVQLRDHDSELNRARLEGKCEFQHTGPDVKIKLLDRIVLSRISSKPNVISCCDWMAEFILGSAVADAFENAGLTGYSVRPVFHPKTDQPHDGYFHLYSESILPLAERDLTTPPFNDSIEGGYRQLACLTYNLGKHVVSADMNRTAENWSSNFMPVWVISARVKECYERNKLRGWAFRPVLEKGSELHAKYLEKWEDLFARISVNPNNRFI